MALPVLLTATGETIDVEKVTNDIADTIVKRIEGLELNIRTMSQVDVVVEPIQLIAPEGDGSEGPGDASKVDIVEQPDAVRLLMSIDTYLHSMHFDALAMRGLKDEVIEIKEQLRMQEELAETKDADKLADDEDAEDDNGGIRELIENIELHTAQTAAHAEKILDKMTTADPDESQEENTGSAGTDPNEKAADKKQGVVGKMFGGIMKTIKSLFKGISLFLVGLAVLAASLISGGGPLMQQVKDLFDTFMNDVLPPLFEGIMKVVDVVMPAVIEIVQTLAQAFGKIVETLMPVILNLVEQLLPPIMQLFNTIMQLFATLMEALMPAINTIMEELIPPIIELFTKLMDIFTEMLVFLTPVFESIGVAIGVVASVLGTAVSAVTDLVGATLAFFQGDTEKAKNMLANAGDKVLIGIADLINGVINFLADLVDMVPGLGNTAEKMRGMRMEFGDRAQARVDERGESDGSTADKMEKEIDFEQDRNTVKEAIEARVADGSMSEVVGQQLLERYDEKKEEETKQDATLVSNKKADKSDPDAMAAAMAELMQPMDTGDTTDAAQEMLAGTPTTPASGINEATTGERESEKDSQDTGGGQTRTDINTQQVNNTTAINNSTTGILSSSGGSSLGSRHRRVLPGVKVG
jgi:hypothetical protein